MYIAKPFEVTARQVYRETVDEIAEWCGGKRYRKPYVDSDGWALDEATVALPSGVVVEFTDWVVKLGYGQFIAVPDILFRAMFEKEDPR